MSHPWNEKSKAGWQKLKRPKKQKDIDGTRFPPKTRERWVLSLHIDITASPVTW